MKLCLKILAVAITAASTYSLIGCAAPAGFSYQNIGIKITAQCFDCPNLLYNSAQPATLLMPNTGQGGTTAFTANVTNAPQVVTWAIFPTPNLGAIDTLPTSTTGAPTEPTPSVGTISAQSGNTAYYADGSPPVYGGVALQQAQNFQWILNGVPQVGIPQGDVMLVASVKSDPSNPSAVVNGYQLVQIYGTTPSAYLTPKTPTSPSGLTNPAVNVARGASFAFFGGIVGAPPCIAPTASTTPVTCTLQVIPPVQVPLNSTDNQAVWMVGTSSTVSTGVIGGNSTLGTITQNGVYTAPTTIPSGFVVVFVTSHLVPTQFSYAYVGVY